MGHRKFPSNLTMELTHKEKEASVPEMSALRHYSQQQDTESTSVAICVWRDIENVTHTPFGIPFILFHSKTGNPVIWDDMDEDCTLKEVNL